MHHPSRHAVNRKPAICVFCGSSHGKDPLYTEAARRLGNLIGTCGFSLVFGAGAVGLMGEVATAAHNAGAPITGVIPQFLRPLEPPTKFADELIVTPDLQQRKQRMLALADAFILLPGGLGTLDEFFEIVTEVQLHVHRKPIVLVNINDYFRPLIQLLDHVIGEEFAAATIQKHYRIAATPDEAIAMILPAFKTDAREAAASAPPD
jgi:uncharacterized protein (TIGR00730 family)